jgi:hypothetical protein
VTTWPALPFEQWADTFDTVHMVVQILGKVRVALSPKEPEWAHITLFVTARGLTTGPVPSNVGLFDVEADFLDHEVVIRTAAGDTRKVALRARPVAEFWAEFVAALRQVGIDVELSPMPQEVPDPIPFPDDTVHVAYDPEAAMRFWRVLTLVEPVFAAWRGDFDGRVSRVQFFWGSADLAVTRFTGQPCAPGSDARRMTSASESEQMNVGWWPGSASFPRAGFYAYAHPKPDGIEDVPLDVPGAHWNDDLGEFILHYDDVRTVDDPAARLREFLDASYTACANQAGWGQSSRP